MNRSKQSGFIGIAFLIVGLVAVGLVGLIGNHPPKHVDDKSCLVMHSDGYVTNACTDDTKKS